ncbi:hypothetical protein DERF_009695 [Dermatophagoides farinae]|uniref:Uncharacterized protein n=1 Tax=Dermatophagoides farinae TaxID=6954 RepID=A0A922L159_DERFA|nr:hypothetical protein DERF_009695 [Dermatophagoides farinae]
MAIADAGYCEYCGGGGGCGCGCSCEDVSDVIDNDDDGNDLDVAETIMAAVTIAIAIVDIMFIRNEFIATVDVEDVNDDDVNDDGHLFDGFDNDNRYDIFWLYQKNSFEFYSRFSEESQSQGTREKKIKKN